MIARLGGILAPLIDGTPVGCFMVVFGGLGMASSLLSLLLKETKGQTMVDTSNHQRLSNKFDHENELKEPLLCKMN